MGRDKASLPFGRETLLERVVRLVRLVLDDVVVSAGDGQPVPAGCRVVRDPERGLGPVPALLQALGEVRHDRAFVVACDTPLLVPSLVSSLVDLSQGWDACVPVVEGVQMTTCAVYWAEAALRLGASAAPPGPRSLRALAAGLRTRFVPADELVAVDPGLRSFVPCNTPEEYRRALELADLPVNDPGRPTV
jgi:molybdopterin-guanine dinucleotide biosynthesis protein A